MATHQIEYSTGYAARLFVTYRRIVSGVLEIRQVSGTFSPRWVALSTNPTADDCDISLAEIGTTGTYTWSDPTGVDSDTEACRVVIQDNLGGAVSLNPSTCPVVASGIVGPTQAALIPTGLDAITVTPTTGAAATFPQMLVQLWRRFCKKTFRDRVAKVFKTYADDGTAVLTTQPYSSTIAGDTIEDVT